MPIMARVTHLKTRSTNTPKGLSPKLKRWVGVVFGVLVGSTVTALSLFIFFIQKEPPMYKAPFQTNILQATLDNQNYRHVLFTGTNSQLVVMSIPPGGEVGQETHKYVEQILYFQAGTGEAILDGKKTSVGPGDVVVVTPGTQHNFINTGETPLKITTTYAPPNHIDGRIQQTKADADADVQDEAFGEAQR
jgi:mannose-6-phosphate isomerase-like protein (cupin superfamily)